MSAKARHGALMRHPALNRMPRDFICGGLIFAAPKPPQMKTRSAP